MNIIKKGNHKLLRAWLLFSGLFLVDAVALVIAYRKSGAGTLAGTNGQIYLLSAVCWLLVAGILFIKWFRSRT